MTTLAVAHQRRRARVEVNLDQRIDSVLDAIGLNETNCSSIMLAANISNADAVGPEARHRLRGILRHYAKSPHPFTACVNDNTKRFGNRAKNVCAVVKDIIRGTTKWRGHPELDHGSPGAMAASQFSELPPVCTHLDEEVIALLEQVDRDKLDELLSEQEEAHATA